MKLISEEWERNLDKIFEKEEHAEQLKSVIIGILNYMELFDWKGACHESCGVLYVIFQELGIPVDWKLGEVLITDNELNERAIYFDHSWITYKDKIIDLAISKPLILEIAQPPTILNVNLQSLTKTNLVYGTKSGIEDSAATDLVKVVPLTTYFNNSPMHPTLGTWSLISSIGKKVGLTINIPELQEKYDGFFWNKI